MKQLSFFAIVLFISLTACKKGDTGPAGPAGTTGAVGSQGPQGIAGSANVLQYTFGEQALNLSFSILSIPTTLDTMNKSAWFVYLYYQPISRWYFLPGLGSGGNTNYRLSMGHDGNKVNIYIDKAGPGELYANAKVIRIYSSGQLAGGRSSGLLLNLPPIDFTNYDDVKAYYHLPD